MHEEIKRTDIENDPDQLGMSPDQVLLSTQEKWADKLSKQGYPGDINKAAKNIQRFCEGYQYAYNRLKRNKLIDDDTRLAGVDFDNWPPTTGITYLIPYHMIVIPVHLLVAFEKVPDDNIVSLGTGQIDPQTQKPDEGFRGLMSDFWFLAAVEEFRHSVDKKIPKETLDPTSSSVLNYHNQDHEYRALGWQVRAIKDNNLNGVTKMFHRDLLRKVVKERLRGK